MSCPKWFFNVLAMVCLVGILFAVVGSKPTAVAQPPIEYSLPEAAQLIQQKPAKPLTLLEAYDLFQTRAQRWQPQGAIAFLQSIDVEGDSRSSGQDGRRRGWAATLVGTGAQSTQLVVRSVDGVIVEESEEPAAPDLVPIPNKPQIDSPKALAVAQTAKQGLGPSADKGRGFHFALDTIPRGSVGILVRASYSGRPALLTIDPTKGSLLSARVRSSENSGGILYSTDAGQTWQASNLNGQLVTAIYAHPLKEMTAYATVIQQGTIVLYQTQDGGQNWSALGSLPDRAGNWANSLAVVASAKQGLEFVVATSSGLWVSAGGKSWSLNKRLPGGPKQWLGAAQSSEDYRLFASVPLGKNRGLYGTTDLSSWDKVAEGSYRLSESFDKTMVLATDEEQPDKALLLDLDSQKNIAIPGKVLRAAGNFRDLEATLFDDSLSGVGRLTNKQFQQTLTADNASLAVAPDFSTNHIAVAGGFRTGIHRTTDGGLTWNTVLTDPSAIVPGSNEVFAVKFLSANSVIAANGGFETWQNF